MNNNLIFKGKNLLYIDTLSEYNLAIKASFEKQGGYVDYLYFDKPGFFVSIKNRYIKDNSKQQFTQKCKEFLILNNKKNYDYILIKAPFLLNHDFFELLINLFPDVKKINYNWSSLKMYDYTPYCCYFNRIITFDSKDAKNNNFIYYPLFFVDEFVELRNKGITEIKYDVSTVGHAYTVGRYEFLSKFRDFAISNGLNIFYYLYAPWISFVKARINKTYIPNTFSRFLTLKDVAKIISSSKAVVDCQMTIQDGLTMRTFETLGSGRKLITSNSNIINESFYNSSDIFIVNNDGSNLNHELVKFINNDSFVEVTKYEDYYIDNWLKKILIEL